MPKKTSTDDDDLDIIDLEFHSSDESFRLDEVVLAKYGDWPWWPAKVLSLTNNGNTVTVKFFNDNVNQKVHMKAIAVRKFQLTPPDQNESCFKKHEVQIQCAYVEAQDYLLACIPKEEDFACASSCSSQASTRCHVDHEATPSSSQQSSTAKVRGTKKKCDNEVKRSSSAEVDIEISPKRVKAAAKRSELSANSRSNRLHSERNSIEVEDKQALKHSRKYNVSAVSKCLTQSLSEELQSIKSGDTASERHTAFADITRRYELWNSASFGPITSDSAQEALARWLAEQFPNFNDLDYVDLVLRHEAILRIIQNIEKCSLSQAAIIASLEYHSTKKARSAIEKAIETRL